MNKLFSTVSTVTLVSGLALASPLATPAFAQSAWHATAGAAALGSKVITTKFYPSIITIDEGDSITWEVKGDAHTISFLSGGAAPSPEDPAAITPSGGSTYDGTGFVSSGLVDPGGSYTLTFTKAGTYTYNCLIHPGMTATVVVQTAGAAYPQTQQDYNRTIRQDSRTDTHNGINLLHEISPADPTTNGDGTSTNYVRTGAGDNGISIMRMLPQTLFIHVGDTVRWNNPDTMMPHTVTFPGADGVVPEDTDPTAFNPAGGSTYDGSVLTSSGLLLPGSTYSLTFTKAGSYDYECLLHDEIGMHGKIVVLR